jgi:hypothetical protein
MRKRCFYLVFVGFFIGRVLGECAWDWKNGMLL